MEKKGTRGVKLDEQTYTAVVALVELSPHPTTIVGVIRQAVFALKAERERQALATASMESTLRRKQMLASRPMRESEARKRNTPIQMSVDRNDPWDAPVGQKAAGCVRRCECGQWRFVTVESCSGCGSKDGYQTRDVGKAWFDAMKSGLTSEDQLIEAVAVVGSGGGPDDSPWRPEPGDEPAFAVRCETCCRWRLDMLAPCPGCGGTRDDGTLARDFLVSPGWRDEIARGGVLVE